MSPYLRVALLEMGIGLATFLTALVYVRLLVWSARILWVPVRTALVLLAYFGLAVAIAAPLLVVLSRDEMRAFSDSGWWPDTWALIWYACAIAPTLWSIGVRRGSDLQAAGWDQERRAGNL